MEGYPNKKIYTAEEIGAPVSPEQLPTKELFKASLSFDFVFGIKDGQKHPFCIEINGEDSGIAGAQKLPGLDSTKKILAGIRDQRDHYALTKNRKAAGVVRDIKNGDFSMTPEGAKKLTTFLRTQYHDKVKMFPNAYINDVGLQSIADDKSKQSNFIPSENLPRILTIDDTDHHSESGYWIVKPNLGIGGRGIQVVSNLEIDSVLAEHRDALQKNYTIQEYVPSAGADMAGPERSEHAASLRLLIDFRYLESDDIDITYAFAYQRVGDVPVNITSSSNKEREETVVINLARGAEAYEASPNEYTMAYEVALKVIHNMAKSYSDDAIQSS